MQPTESDWHPWFETFSARLLLVAWQRTRSVIGAEDLNPGQRVEEVKTRLENVERIRAMELKTGPDCEWDGDVHVAVPHAATHVLTEHP